MSRAYTNAYDANIITTVPAENPFTVVHKAMFDKTNPTSLFSRILKESGEVEIAKGAQIPVTEELERLTLRLRKYDADFHKVFDMAIDRGDIPSGAGGREYYGRDAASTSIPELTSYDDLVAVAEKIVTGEARRLAAEGLGGVPMAMPSAAQVGAARDEFHDERLLSLQAQTRTDQEKEDLKALWAEALAGVEELWGAVEYHHRHDKDMASFRAKCARFGVEYEFDTPDPDEPPTPPAPTPPNS